MKLKQLETCLQQIDSFETPKLKYEQYETGNHIAARILYTIQSSYGDICGNSVADLGCGCGKLLIGCALIGANYALGVDIDMDAIKQSQLNCEKFDDYSELSSIDLLCADICDRDLWQPFRKCFDVVIMNPPFGTKQNKGMDMIFLETALELSNKSVYSLHKSSTRSHILKKAMDWGVKCEVLAQLRYDIPNTYKFHKHSTTDIQVDFYRFSHI